MCPPVLPLWLSALCAGMALGALILGGSRRRPASAALLLTLSIVILLWALLNVGLFVEFIPDALDLSLCAAFFLAGLAVRVFPLSLGVPLLVLAGFALVFDAAFYQSLPQVDREDPGLRMRVREGAVLSPEGGYRLEILFPDSQPYSIALPLEEVPFGTVRSLNISYVYVERSRLLSRIPASPRLGIIRVDDDTLGPLWQAKGALLRRLVLGSGLYVVQYRRLEAFFPSPGMPFKLSFIAAENELP